MWPSSAELDARESKSAFETDPTAKARSSIRRRPAVRQSPNARDNNRLSANARTMRALHLQMEALDRDFDSLTRHAHRRGTETQIPDGPRFPPFENVQSHDLDVADILSRVPNLPEGFDPSLIRTVNVTIAEPVDSAREAMSTTPDFMAAQGSTLPTPPDANLPDVSDMPPLRRVSAHNRRHYTPYARRPSTLTPAPANGLGDRSRSFSPEDDTDPSSWRNLLTTIRPDEHLPSASSSFTASASSALSSFTSDAPPQASADLAAHREAWVCEDSDSGMEEEDVSRVMRRASRNGPGRRRETVILRYGRRGLPFSPPDAMPLTQLPSPPADPPTFSPAPPVDLPSPGPLSPSHPEPDSFAARHRRLQEREAALRRLTADRDPGNEAFQRYSANIRARARRLHEMTRSLRRSNHEVLRHAGQPPASPDPRPPPSTVTARVPTVGDGPAPIDSMDVDEEPQLRAWEDRVLSRLRALAADRAANRIHPDAYTQLRADVRAMPRLPHPVALLTRNRPQAARSAAGDPAPTFTEETAQETEDALREAAERRVMLLEEVERAIAGYESTVEQYPGRSMDDQRRRPDLVVERVIGPEGSPDAVGAGADAAVADASLGGLAAQEFL